MLAPLTTTLAPMAETGTWMSREHCALASDGSASASMAMVRRQALE